MRLVETIARELGHQFEDVIGARRVNALVIGAADEALLLGVHLGLDLLAHGAAQEIGFAQRITRQHLGDLHHLFLIDDDAVGFLEQRLKQRMKIIRLLIAFLAGDEARDIVHRAGTIECVDGDDVLDAVGMHLAQHITHAGTFQLEHAHRVAMAQHVVGLLVVVGNLVDVEGGLAQADQFQRLLDDSQGLEAEEVELHKARLLDIFHIELGGRNGRTRIAVERHQFFQRSVANDDARRVRRGIAVEALELQCDLEEGLHRGVAVALFLQPGFVIQRLLQRHRIGRIHRNEFRQPVDLAIGHLQHAAHVTRHHARLQFAEGDDLRHPVLAITLLHVGDDFVAPVLAKIDVEVRHRHALRIEKALEQQVEAEGIEIGDGQHIGDQRTGTRAAPRPHRDTLRLGIFDEVGDDQEVAGKLHLGDDIKFEVEALGILIAAAAFHHAAGGKPLNQSLMRLAPQFLGLVTIGEARQDGRPRHDAEGAAHGDLDGVVDGFWNVGKERHHFGLRLEIMLGRQPPPVFGGDDFALGDANQRIMGGEVLRFREIRLVAGDQWQPKIIGNVDEARLSRPLGFRAVALQFDIETVAEQGLQALGMG